jgi:3-phosphoshikimate 1-carboxyvinyltransferase
MFLGLAAGVPGLTVLTGDDTLRRRPMLRVVAPLRQMGATIDGRRHGDLAPLAVRGGDLQGLEYELKVASAQVKTALLFAGLRAAGRTSVAEPAPSRDHTERMLVEAGISLERGANGVALMGPQEVEACRWKVPGDISSGLFLIAAALLRPGSDLVIDRVGLNPTRTAALEVLREMGADLTIEPDSEPGDPGEPVGKVRARHSGLRAAEVSGTIIPSLIDEIPILAVVATQAEGITTFADAGELRVKESDRIEAMVEGITVLGGTAEATRDGLRVTGPSQLQGGIVDSRGDHRVALAFAVAGLVATSTVTVKGWAATNTSFPEFLDLLGEATRAR